MQHGADSQILSGLRLIKVDGAVRVRGPICPGIDTVLVGFLQVEEHAASEDAEKCRITEGVEDAIYDRAI